MAESTELYSLRKDVKCIECGCRGAVKSYGKYYFHGLGDEVDEFTYSKAMMEKYRNAPYMSKVLGYGGTIPYECLNCGNIGLIDYGGLEGYKKAFVTVGETEKTTYKKQLETVEFCIKNNGCEGKLSENDYCKFCFIRPFCEERGGA